MKEYVRRAGWIFLVLLFVITGLGIGVWGFWEATHQPTNSETENTQTDEQCTINVVQSQAVLKNPEAFKPSEDVKRLQVTDIEQGNGRMIKSGDCIIVKYYGTLASDGSKFDGNYDTPTALKLLIGKGQVIQGWDQGLLGMKVGGTRRVVIPSELAYGSQGQSSIPPNADLVFEVKVLDTE